MGCDIEGWVEFRVDDHSYWLAAVNVGTVAGRDYDIYGKLFGVQRGRNHFEPIAANRGFPDDMSDVCALMVREFPFWSFGDTWIGADELPADKWTGYWADLRQHIDLLSERYGISNVRMVVWFNG